MAQLEESEAKLFLHFKDLSDFLARSDQNSLNFDNDIRKDWREFKDKQCFCKLILLNFFFSPMRIYEEAREDRNHLLFCAWNNTLPL